MTALLAARFLLGIGEAVIFPASNRLVANWLPRAERGLANGIIFAGVGIGAGIAPPLITWIILTSGWRWSFYASALIGLLVLVGWVTMVRDTPSLHGKVAPAERDLIEADAGSAVQGQQVGWMAILRRRTVMLLALSYFTYGYVAYIFFTWFFKYLSSVRGLDLKASAVYGMLPFIGMAIASPLGGWIADRLEPRHGSRLARCWTAAVALCAAALFVALATQVNDARLASLFLAGGAGALYLSQSAYWTLSANLGGASAGSVSGFMNMANQIGGMATASLTPFIAQTYGWTASFLFAAGLCLVGALLWLLIDPDDRIEAAA
jgi:ACS family glucarate transporter-like MFS transporter